MAFGVNVLGIKGPRKMMALLPRLPEGSASVTGFRPSPYGKTALLDRCSKFGIPLQACKPHINCAFVAPLRQSISPPCGHAGAATSVVLFLSRLALLGKWTQQLRHSNC